MPSDDLAITLGVAIRAMNLEFENRTGEWWWLNIMILLGAEVPSSTRSSGRNTEGWDAI